MNKEIKSDDIIFNFFKQINDEKDDLKCIELGNNWIDAMKINLTSMEKNLKEAEKCLKTLKGATPFLKILGVFA